MDMRMIWAGVMAATVGLAGCAPEEPVAVSAPVVVFFVTVAMMMRTMNSEAVLLLDDEKAVKRRNERMK